MPATVPTRGVLKASQNRVRTSVALQGSSMWENVIGIVNEERGANAGVEALINAPQRGGGNRKADKEARRAAAQEAVLATGGFDTAITNYNELLSLAKSQGAMGEGSTRGACKICGQLGHLTKQCRNQFSKFFNNPDGKPTGGDGQQLAGAPGEDNNGPAHSDSSLDSLMKSIDSSGSDSDSSSSDSEAERRRRKRKERKRKRERKEKKRRHKESRDRKSSKDRRHSKHKKSRRRRSRSPSPR